MKKRLLSMALALALWVGMAPISVFAGTSLESLPGGFWVDENNTLWGYSGEGGDVMIPDGITEIGSMAFDRNETITSVVIPEGVTVIQRQAFNECTNLTYVILPDTLIAVNDFAFSGTGLTSLILPDSVEEIGAHAFSLCQDLTQVHFGKGLISLGQSAFYCDNALTEALLPIGVKEIESFAFSRCRSLTTVAVPASVERLDGLAFDGCDTGKLTILCEKGSLAETIARENPTQTGRYVLGTFDENGTFTPNPEQPEESGRPAEDPMPGESTPPTETPVQTPTPTPKPTPSGGSGSGSGSGGGGGAPVSGKSEDPLRVQWEYAQHRQEALLSQQANSPGYLENLTRTKAVLEEYTGARYYVHTVVTDQVQKLSDEVCAGRSSDLDKALAIYDWITSNIYYDMPRMFELHEPSAQQVLDERRWVCSGFASLFQAMCWAQKIPCVYVGGSVDDQNHVWNAVKIGERWFWSDPTFGCKHILDYSTEDVIENQAGLLYFLCSSEFFAMDHEPGSAVALNVVTYDELTVEEQEELVAEQLESPSLSHWAKEEVCCALRTNLVPQGLLWNYSIMITREDFCGLMVRLFTRYYGQDIDACLAQRGLERSDPFEDTDDPDVLAAYALGIVKGTSATTFSPRDRITRQEAAVMLERTGRLLDIEAGQGVSFADAGTFTGWAAEGIGYVSGVADPFTGKRVMEGTGSGNFSPLETYTQEQAIITALRLFSASGGQTVRKSPAGE